MRAGSLRHRVTFQSATITDDAFGEPDQTWADITTVWARVEPITGVERFSALQMQTDVSYRIVCRYSSVLSTLAPDDRATWNGITFDIKSILNTGERDKELQVFVKRHI